jgi:hypothetical protein
MNSDPQIAEKRRWRAAVAGAVFLFCVAMLYLAPDHSGRTPPGTAYYNAAWLLPVAALLLAGVAALVVAAKSLRAVRRDRSALTFDLRKWGPAALAASFAAYVQLTLLIGYTPATAVYILALFQATGLRLWRHRALAVAMAIALQLLFLDLLDIWMPAPVYDLVGMFRQG